MIFFVPNNDSLSLSLSEIRPPPYVASDKSMTLGKAVNVILYLVYQSPLSILWRAFLEIHRRRDTSALPLIALIDKQQLLWLRQISNKNSSESADFSLYHVLRKTNQISLIRNTNQNQPKMSLLSPKTIVITTVPGKTQSRPITVQAPMDVDYYSEDQDEGPRKRRRLTHLSPEEKMMRR